MQPGGDGSGGKGPGRGEGESLAEVLASIRALVSAEAEARGPVGADGETVLMLTPEMRLDAPEPAEAGEAAAQPAPNLDEAALRAMINAIVREELQGELGERISRNMRKLIRREIAEALEEHRKG